MSGQTVIIATVCSAVGALILALFLWRALRSRCRSSPVPLPPIQPLARQREQQRRAFHPDAAFLSPHSAQHLHASTSKVSLLGKESIPDSRSLSVAPTSEIDCAFDDLPPPPRSSPTSSSPAHPPAPLSHSTRHAPPSASAHGTVRSKSSRSAIRGAPHRSAVQIVLPAPLAPEVISYNYVGPGCFSVVDKWIPTSRDCIHESPGIMPSASRTLSQSPPMPT